jgi:hypothetical protein
MKNSVLLGVFLCFLAFILYFFILGGDVYNFVRGRSYKDAEGLKIGMKINELVETMNGAPDVLFEYPYNDTTKYIGLIYRYKQAGGVEIRIYLDERNRIDEVVWDD